MAYKVIDRSSTLLQRAGGSRWWGHPSAPLLFSLLLTSLMALLLLTRSWFSNPIAWDGFGYWLYLPLVFVHHDLGMSDPTIVQGMFDAYAPSTTFYQAHQGATGLWVIRYTPGLAVLHLPGFLVAHLLAGPLGFPADGLSFPYMVAVLGSSLLWLWIGLYSLVRWLQQFVTGALPFIVVTVMLSGTNLFDQVIEHPLMTHLYTFSLLAILLWRTLELHRSPTPKHALLAGIALGLLVLVRPTNALAALIPALWPLGERTPWAKLKYVFMVHRRSLFFFCLAAALPVLLLLGYWKTFSGEWIYNSYQNPGEGLDLLHPHLSAFVFSYRKGWLLYTPLVIVGLVGLFLLIPRSLRRLRLPLWTFLIVFLYVVSTWTIWYYPGGFGQRAAVDVLPVVALGMAFAFHRAAASSWSWSVLLAVMVVLLVLFMHFQLWQQRQHFRPADRMTKAYYWATLLQTEPDSSHVHLLGPDRVSPPVAPDTTHHLVYAHWVQPWPDGADHIQLHSASPFTPALERQFHALTPTDHAWVHVHADVVARDTAGSRISLVMHMEHEGTYGYRTFPVIFHSQRDTVFSGSVDAYYLTPEPRRAEDLLRVYIWHQGGPPASVHHLSVRSWIPSHQ